MKRGNIQKDHVGLFPSCLLCQVPCLLSNPAPHTALSSLSDSFLGIDLDIPSSGMPSIQAPTSWVSRHPTFFLRKLKSNDKTVWSCNYCASPGFKPTLPEVRVLFTLQPQHGLQALALSRHSINICWIFLNSPCTGRDCTEQNSHSPCLVADPPEGADKKENKKFVCNYHCAFSWTLQGMKKCWFFMKLYFSFISLACPFYLLFLMLINPSRSNQLETFNLSETDHTAPRLKGHLPANVWGGAFPNWRKTSIAVLNRWFLGTKVNRTIFLAELAKRNSN